jgi:hypothetical protein
MYEIRKTTRTDGYGIERVGYIVEFDGQAVSLAPVSSALEFATRDAAQEALDNFLGDCRVANMTVAEREVDGLADGREW